MKILIKNCILVSMDETKDKVQNDMDVLIEENVIKKIGKNICEANIDKVIDATHKVVMPGLINLHAHVPMSIFRETMEGYKTQDWLEQRIWPMEAKLTSEDIYYSSLLSFIEMIKTGTTTANDMYFNAESIIKAMEEAGVRLQLTEFLIRNLSNEQGDRKINELRKVIARHKDSNPRLTLNVGVHGLYTCDDEYINKALTVARENVLPVHMHFCENASEIIDITKLHNKKPIEVLQNKFSDLKLILAHCVKLTSDDIQKLSSLNVSVAHCPVSNLRLGCGVAKICEMKDMGINVGLGTDGQGSGSNLDMFETMKYTTLLQKGILENPDVLSPYEVLKMATINGAKALGQENSIGSIEEGKFADLIIIDIDDVVIKPVNSLISELVYNVKGNNVVTTIVDGKILMEDRQILSLNCNHIYNKCDEIIKRIS